MENIWLDKRLIQSLEQSLKELPAGDKRKLKNCTDRDRVLPSFELHRVTRQLQCFFYWTKGPSTSGAYMLHHFLGHVIVEISKNCEEMVSQLPHVPASAFLCRCICTLARGTTNNLWRVVCTRTCCRRSLLFCMLPKDNSWELFILKRVDRFFAKGWLHKSGHVVLHFYIINYPSGLTVTLVTAWWLSSSQLRDLRLGRYLTGNCEKNLPLGYCHFDFHCPGGISLKYLIKGRD